MMLGYYLMFNRNCAEALETYSRIFNVPIEEKQCYGDMPPKGIPGDTLTSVKYCQSCGMPFDEAHKELIAKEADGSDSIYCTYCYKDGKFLDPGATVRDMVEMGVPHLGHKIGEAAAREQLSKFVPTLARWN